MTTAERLWGTGPFRLLPVGSGIGALGQAHWQRIRSHRRGGWLATYGPNAAVILFGLGLLLGFQHVVRGGVEQGAQRHKAWVSHADATWRCQALRDRGASTICLAQLGPAP